MEGRLQFLFVSSVGGRKGVPELLEAWRRAALIDAELLIIGNVEPAVSSVRGRADRRRQPHAILDENPYYKSSDVFVWW